MPDLKPYKVEWRSLIDANPEVRAEEFDTQNDAENFILRLKMARNREFVRANFKRNEG